MSGNLDELETSDKITLLCVGESGSGKTGGLASLVDAGYRLRILDFDQGVRALKGHVKRKDLLGNVNVQQFADTFKSHRPGPVKGVAAVMAMKLTSADAHMRAMRCLEDWPDGIGPIEAWEPDDILVIDSMTFMAKAALNMIMFMNGRMAYSPEQSDYFAAQETVERVMAQLTGSAVPCHIIVNTHIDLRGQEGATIQKAYPMVIGKSLSPKIGTFFNNLVAFRRTQTGKNEIRTKFEGLLSCKVEVSGLAETLPVETGMADLFAHLLGRKGPRAPASATATAPTAV